MFDHDVCGVDDTHASLEAVRQAARLRAPGGSIRLVGVLDIAVLVKAGWSARVLEDELRRRLEEVLAEAGRDVRDAVREVVVDGSPAPVLLEAARRRATLVAVGTHGGRPDGRDPARKRRDRDGPPDALLGSRRAPDPGARRIPHAIVAAVDGSPHSFAALAAARELRERFVTALDVVAASGGKPVYVAGLRRIDELEWDERAPVDALVARSADADLVVLGSRALQGVEALGSVGERVAHRAHSSVLVVRPPRAG